MVMSNSSYVNLSESFVLDKSQRNFQRQYAHIYAQRLATLRPLVEKRAKKKWGDDVTIFKLCDLEKDKRCVVIGTFYKDQRLKPSILREISEENQLVPVPQRERYNDDNDQLILEDELQRIILVSNVEAKLFVTGIVAAVLGEEREDELGKFQVEDIIFADLGPQGNVSLPNEDCWIAFLSGFNIGNSDDGSVVDSLKRLAESSVLRDVNHLIIAGNCLGRSASDKDAIAHQARYLSRKTDAASVEGMKRLDSVLKILTARTTVHLMPGRFDPANYIMPQQPLLRMMFPEACGLTPNGDQKPNHNLITVTNPYYFKVGSVDILGTSGENIDDLFKYSCLNDCLERLECTIRWGHIAPTCPDTLGCYPYFDKDPFIFDSCPRVYFAGNQDTLKWKTVKGENGQECFLLTIPKFSDEKKCVLLNLKDMAVKDVKV